MRYTVFLVLCLMLCPSWTSAEVTKVTIASRSVVADGRSFGSTGRYEKLVGRIEFALDPADSHNARIADLQHAPRTADGRVHFSSDLYVLRPVEPAKGNGVLLFEISNRGKKGLLNTFHLTRTTTTDPTTAADFGEGFLMNEGYTLVWVGWEIDVPAPLMRIDAPLAMLPPGTAVDPLSVEVLVNVRATEAFLIDEPGDRLPTIYPPEQARDQRNTLTVRDRFWSNGTVIPSERWRFVTGPNNVPKLHLDDGFEPGRFYKVTYYPATPAVVAGVGLAAIRDAAAAFRYRSDLPVHGDAAYVFGSSQSGRFLRQFLHDGFNVDERDHRVFDAVWAHIAGAARGNFNERFAIPTHGSMFTPTKFPFADLDQTDTDGTRSGIQAVYRPDQRPKVFYTNTPVEYWGGGRAAALTHTTVDGTRDLTIPANVRIYLLAGTQHGAAAFPPPVTHGQQLNNPIPQVNVMRALLRGLNAWVARDVQPPASQYPRVSDKTLVSVPNSKFPSIPGVRDPRTIEGPGRMANGKLTPLPYLVPQVDRDGNDIAGIRVPEFSVPLATSTGWNFRSDAAGNPGQIYQLLGSYVPFAKTRKDREARGDARLSIEERYRDRDDYLQRIRSAATDLIRSRYLLSEDLDDVLARAKSHWDFATRTESSSAAHP